ncbi:MAG TPA: hypothetical protein PK745_05655 [bacterium]|nr:hypothetical protein [bacterium]
MKKYSTLKEMTPARRRLVTLMLELNFGYIEILHVKDGEPCFRPPPRVIHDVVFGRENDAHACSIKEDFVLKRQVAELLEQIERIQDGMIHSLTVQNGLPVRMKLEKPYRA